MGLIAWQGWQLHVPDGCDPVRLEGDARTGQALIADLERPRLGLRWTQPRKRQNAATLVQKVLRDEVGNLACDRAKSIDAGEGWSAALLFVEPEPPGRDVFVGLSTPSGRLVQVVYHAKRRDRVLKEQILPTLKDTPAGQPRRWAVYDLSCESPAGFDLVGQRLLAGDLALTFENGKVRQRLTIRQVALAEMALARQPLESWVAAQQAVNRKHFRAVNGTTPFHLLGMTGVAAQSVRRRRFFFARNLPPALETRALHDRAHDRLILLEGTGRELIETAAGTIGWTRGEKR
jgi:hypothetical protein